VWKWEPEAFGERVRALRTAWAAEGRRPESARVSLGLYTLVGEDERDLIARFRALQRWTPGGALDGETLEDYGRETLTGTPEACLERLERFAGHGVEEFIVGAGPIPFSVYDWSMVELFADAVLPAARSL
jgi:alkanesulfonate monooxygenase SsuD/methylene tetrahydromethanopterin reductase-like flavin-dependent oxidoreductase (luciferase family)